MYAAAVGSHYFSGPCKLRLAPRISRPKLAHAITWRRPALVTGISMGMEFVGAIEEEKQPQSFRAEKKLADCGSPDDAKIDPAFIVAPEFRPRCSQKGDDLLEDGGVPLLDLSVLRSMGQPPSPFSTEDLNKMYEPNNLERISRRRKSDLIKEVGQACQDWGFFQVVNHGVEAQLLENLEAEMKKFFALPTEEKRRVLRTEDNPTVGYFDSELTKNVRDWKEVFDFVQGSVVMPESYDDGVGTTAGECVYTNKWPQNFPAFRITCMKWAEAMEKLSFELLGLISESMGLPLTYFHKHFREKNTTFVRLNHYPECPSPELALGVSGHKDAGALTVLWQDETGGLEVRRKDGEWIALPPYRDALIVNVGDILQVWSNDKYMSVEHRAVVNERKNRYSIPYFFNPAHVTDVFPASELTDATHPPRYRPYNWGYVFKRRKDANLRSTDKDLHFASHYAIN